MIRIKYLVTSALPYVNNELHLGQFVGCILPADVYSRFLRLKEEKCIYVCGTDEYGTPIEVAAQKEGLKPKELADKYYDLQKKAVEGFNISTDIFSRTTSLDHIDVVQDFYKKLDKNGYTYRKKIEQLYCEECKRFLPDRYIEGECPHCGKEARGDQCDVCGQPLEPTDLINSYCITCKNKPIIRESEHIFFDLPKTQGKLQEWIEKHHGLFQNAKNFSLSFLKEGLQEKDISRNLSWGVPVPNMDDLVFYVWFDAPIGYITFTKQLGKENWWKEEDTQLVHFLGKDNIVFHTIYFPGMLTAHGEYKVPDRIASYEFLTFGGSKLSKSKGRLIKALEALETYPTDYWRFVLISLLPENRDSDFTWEIFQEKINTELNDTVGNLVHRTLTFAKKFYGGSVEKPKLSEKDMEIIKAINYTTDNTRELLYEIKLKNGLQEIMNLARLGNQFITTEEPWKNEDRRQNVVYVSLSIVKALSILMEPFVPESADRIKGFLNLHDLKWEDSKKMEDSFKVNDFEALFRKIDNDEIKKVIEKFEVKKNIKGVKDVSDVVNYDDFRKMKLKVAQIESVEDIGGADKLYKLSVDMGEKRTLVAGIKPYYSKEELAGKQIIILSNLEPRKMRGTESQGMLLAAVKGDDVALLTVDRKMPNGADVE